MKQIFFFLLCIRLLLLLPVHAQPAVEENPKALHNLAMKNLLNQSVLWREIAKKEKQKRERDLYHKVADSYLQLKEIREETFRVTQNKQPVPYEKLIQAEQQHAQLLKQAELAYGPNAPKLPPEQKAPPPRKTTSPTPTPPATYRSESGFEVILRLEE